ncbi:chemotaxis protein CheW [Maritimibacter sp. DP1N21-5]|uniref:chemotaxis protein CheW n=1 Tax=Maritimibacter sp. DP1N21-5 TaxID=2836867 RepID=UPI001C472929|nr:chemotaxis protein CheW [Maritimibacter sp. DP1N21-5]MBV7409866.1 chemotaxis protein CheW [Maritimibacter sp. DP1N21-5]
MSERLTPDGKRSDSQHREYLSFLVGGQDYCVDIMQVREIRSGARATTLPHAPDYMRGVINLRGTVLPIMDLATRLGILVDTASARSVIIVVALGDQIVGLMVDAVSDILAVASEDLQPPPELPADDQRRFVSALTIKDDTMIRVLDLATVLPRKVTEVA